jgi:phage shock protein C
MLAGICGGMAEYFRIDPTIVRIIWVVAAFLSLGIVVLLYVILIFVIPSEDDVPPHSVRSAS